MSAYCAPPRQITTLYFAECQYGRLGNEFQATDRDRNSRAEIIRQIRTREITPIKIIEVVEPCFDWPCGIVQDVTAELIAEAEQSAEPIEAEVLRGMLIDHARDLKRDGVFGW
jgi:hypothetical protein